MKRVWEFFKSLFDTTSNTDEKIVVGFMSFAMMCFITLCTLFFGLIIPFEIFSAFFVMTMGCFGLGVYANNKATDAKAGLADSIIKSDAEAGKIEQAKDVLQDEKPAA